MGGLQRGEGVNRGGGDLHQPRTHSLTHSLINSFTHLLTYSLTHLHQASAGGDGPWRSELQIHSMSTGETALYLACQEGHLDVVHLLLQPNFGFHEVRHICHVGCILTIVQK